MVKKRLIDSYERELNERELEIQSLKKQLEESKSSAAVSNDSLY